MIKKDVAKLNEIYDFLDEKPKTTRKEKKTMLDKMTVERRPTSKEDIQNSILDDFKPLKDPVYDVKDDPPQEIPRPKPARVQSSITEDIRDDIIKGEQQKTDLANTCELLLNEKWRKRKTRLRDRSVPALTTLETLADLYDVEWLRNWIDSYTEYVTSEDGKGRQEIVDIAKYSIDKETSIRKEMFEMMGKR